MIKLHTLSFLSIPLYFVFLYFMQKVPKRDKKLNSPEFQPMLQIAFALSLCADGFLYFEAEFNIYDRDSSIGWRDGYRRLQTDVYRLNLHEDVIELLYSY